MRITLLHDRLVYIIGKIIFIGLSEIGLHCVAERIERTGEMTGGFMGTDMVYIGSRNGTIRLSRPYAGLERSLSSLVITAPLFISEPVPNTVTMVPRGMSFCGECVLCIFHLPDVLVQQRLRGNDLAAVGHAAAADREDEIDLVFARKASALLHL